MSNAGPAPGTKLTRDQIVQALGELDRALAERGVLGASMEAR
jgi:hypothetical protein